ncbi:MAG: NRDE family protein [Sandaracinaceae bacterium]
MCTLIAIKDRRRRLPLVVAANRDEVYSRPTGGPRVLFSPPPAVGGVDLERGGTWMGVTGDGLFVGLTNQRPRDRSDPAEKPRSRGRVVLDALAAGTPAGIDALLRASDPAETNGYNLMYGDAETLKVAYSRPDEPEVVIEPLDDGLWVLANDRIGSPDFPKADRARALAAPLAERDLPWAELAAGLRAILADRHRPDWAVIEAIAEGLPFAPAVLRELQALCIRLPFYGTRSATLVALEPGGVAHYLFADGPPDQTPFEDFTGLLRRPDDGSAG